MFFNFIFPKECQLVVPPICGPLTTFSCPISLYMSLGKKDNLKGTTLNKADYTFRPPVSRISPFLKKYSKKIKIVTPPFFPLQFLRSRRLESDYCPLVLGIVFFFFWIPPPFIFLSSGLDILKYRQLPSPPSCCRNSPPRFILT